MAKQIAVKHFQSAAELIGMIDNMILESGTDSRDVYISNADRLVLIEETLTDGSKVYNLYFAESNKQPR